MHLLLELWVESILLGSNLSVALRLGLGGEWYSSFISFKCKSFQEGKTRQVFLFTSLRHFHVLNLVWDQDFKSALNVTLRCSDSKEVHWDLILKTNINKHTNRELKTFLALQTIEKSKTPSWKTPDCTTHITTIILY